MNALNRDMLERLSHLLMQIEKNDEIRVIVLTGAGEKAFVAGADISELATFNALQVKQMTHRGHEIMNRLENIPKTCHCGGQRIRPGGRLGNWPWPVILSMLRKPRSWDCRKSPWVLSPAMAAPRGCLA